MKHLNEFNDFDGGSAFSDELGELPSEVIKPDIRDINIGDTIILYDMHEEKDPIKDGTSGIITLIQPSINMIYVDWENGRNLNVIYDVDNFSIIHNS